MSLPRILLRLAFPLTIMAGVLGAQETTPATLRSLSGAAFDSAFLRQLVEEDNRGVLVAETATRNATTEELKRYAADLIVRQKKEIDALETLRTGGAGVSATAAQPGGAESVNEPFEDARKAVAPAVAPELRETSEAANSPEARANSNRLAQLDHLSGAEFDRGFVNEMLAQTTDRLELAQLAKQRGSADAVKALADQIARDAANEQRQLQQKRRDLAPGGKKPAGIPLP